MLASEPTRVRQLVERALRWLTLVACTALAACTLSGVWTSRARAEPELSLSWPTHARCPDQTWVLARVEAQLGRALGDARVPLHARASIRESARTFELTLETEHDDVRGARRFRAARCEQVAEAAALVLALSIGAQSETEPVVPRDMEVPAPRTTLPDAAPATERRAPTRFSAVVGALLERGLLPHAGVGPELGVGLAWRRSRATLSGLWLPPARSPRGDDGGKVAVSLWAARAGYCHTLLGRPRARLAGCAGLELGRAAGQGIALARPETRRTLWCAASLSARLSTQLVRRLGLYLEPGLAVPFVRRQFVSSDGQGQRLAILHTPQATSKRVSVGIELFF